ncbi:MAG TPA: hypothetical protein VLV16_05220 [Gemmatimonadales bacterium]|nr:hypothetical protein [Gemmatimonadales bacterium]
MLRKTWSYGKFWPMVLIAACGGADPVTPSLAMCGPGVPAVLLGPGESVALDPLTTNGCAIFPANPSSTDSAEYLVVPQAATTSPDFHSSFKLVGGALAAAAPPVAAAMEGAPISIAQQFHDRLRLMEQDRSFPTPARPSRIAGPQPNSTPYPCPVTVGGQCTFIVIGNLTNIQITRNVTATAQTVGQHVVIYVDNSAPTPGISTAQLDSLRNTFDTLLYAVDTTAFGRESDVDGNGKVIVLMTGVLNSLVTETQCNTSGYVVGFFFGADIDPAFYSSWNKGEVFYSIVPDSNRTLSCTHPVSQVMRVLPLTFAHEFQHMISYNQHVLLKHASPEELWLNEGLSHYAEERSGRAFLAAGDSTHFCVHVKADLYNFGLFVQNPGKTGLVTLTGLGTLDERGAWWSFVRFLVDQFAADTSLAAGDAFTRSLVQTNLRGTSNITTVTGQSFDVLSRRWLLANYVSDLPGFTAAPTMKYKHWAFRTAYPAINASCPDPRAPLPNAYPLAPAPIAGAGISVAGTMYASSAGTYQLAAQPPAGSPFTLLLSDGAGAALQQTVTPRLQVIRIR